MLSFESVCSIVRHKQLLFFSFQVLERQKSYIFAGFLALPPLFSRRLMETSLLGAPSQDLLSRMAFFDVIFYYFLDAFLKKRRALPFWKSDVNRLQTGIKIFY